MSRTRPFNRSAQARRGCLLALLVTTVAQPGDAQEVGARVPSVLASLAGDWLGEGELLGRPAVFRMSWSTDTDDFAHLSFSNAWIDAGGSTTPVLRAEAVYLLRGATAVGVWVDDRPQRISLSAVLDHTSWITTWTAETESGRTEYVVRSDDTVVVRDFVTVEGTDRPCAEATYTRWPPR